MIKLSKKAQAEKTAWEARVAAENLAEGKTVMVKRVITNSLDHILSEWWEPATIVEIRNFDALVTFADGTKSSSGLGLKAKSFKRGDIVTIANVDARWEVLSVDSANLTAWLILEGADFRQGKTCGALVSALTLATEGK